MSFDGFFLLTGGAAAAAGGGIGLSPVLWQASISIGSSCRSLTMRSIPLCLLSSTAVSGLSLSNASRRSAYCATTFKACSKVCGLPSCTRFRAATVNLRPRMYTFMIRRCWSGFLCAGGYAVSARSRNLRPNMLSDSCAVCLVSSSSSRRAPCSSVWRYIVDMWSRISCHGTCHGVAARYRHALGWIRFHNARCLKQSM